MSSAVTLTGQECWKLYIAIGNAGADPKLAEVVSEIIDRRLAGAPDKLDRVKDLLFDWGQDFTTDEDVHMGDVLEDLWSAIAGMPPGTKVDALPSRAPVVCPHLKETQPAFAETWDMLWTELTDLRAARDRIRAVCDLAEQVADAIATPGRREGPSIIAVDDVRVALTGAIEDVTEVATFEGGRAHGRAEAVAFLREEAAVNAHRGWAGDARRRHALNSAADAIRDGRSAVRP